MPGCRCGVERKFYDYNRIVGGEKIGRDKVCMDLICMAFIMYNVRNIFHSLSEWGFEILKTYQAPAHI